jgi:FAD/FMN-containing dehydrogenase
VVGAQVPAPAAQGYGKKLENLRALMRGRDCGAIGLAKNTSNLFRDRNARERPKLDLSGFDQIVGIDPAAGTVECEGMATYSNLLDATLAHGFMPCVVPQLKSITLGGAAAGVGIEASSFRHGLVHETLRSMDVLLADGSVITCTPENEHSDLFFGFPNSYGTLGYALKLTAQLVPAKRYVRLTHVRHSDATAYFGDMEERCRGDADFIDGTVFSANEMYITTGHLVDSCAFTSDYSFENIYYRSIREKPGDYLTIHDYIWRWDTDWFWCSNNFFAHHPLVRRLLGRGRLNSVTYQKIMRWNSKIGLVRALSNLTGTHSEPVIQDIDIPVANAAEFLAFLLREVGIVPIWMCPFRACDPASVFPLYRLEPQTLYVNFGFWDSVRHPEPRPPGYVNRRIELMTRKLAGIKSLYSDAFFPEDEFWAIYDGTTYGKLKRRYDPHGKLRNLYEKCVLRQ